MKVIFLSYAHEDQTVVHQIYYALKERGLNPWVDQPPKGDPPSIPPGVEWDSFIRQKLREARSVLLFLSPRSIGKDGYVQREYRLALTYLEERPPNSQYLIPVLLEPCDVPNICVETHSLRNLQWFPLYEFGLPMLVDELAKIAPPRDSLSQDGLISLLDIALENARESEARYWRAQIDKKYEEIDSIKRQLVKELARADRDNSDRFLKFLSHGERGLF